MNAFRFIVRGDLIDAFSYRVQVSSCLRDEEPKNVFIQFDEKRKQTFLFRFQNFEKTLKTFETNLNGLNSKNEQLERNLSQLIKDHKQEMLECRLSYEKLLQNSMNEEIRTDLENTIYSLKQQIGFLQQRIVFLQRELDQYIELYGHQPIAVDFEASRP